MRQILFGLAAGEERLGERADRKALSDATAASAGGVTLISL
jgi:hypothetical protein